MKNELQNGNPDHLPAEVTQDPLETIVDKVDVTDTERRDLLFLLYIIVNGLSPSAAGKKVGLHECSGPRLWKTLNNQKSGRGLMAKFIESIQNTYRKGVEMLDSEKSLNSLKAQEAELKTQREKLAKEISKVTDQYCRDKLQVAVVLCDKLFKNIFQGEIAEQFANLNAMVLEVAATDPRAEARLAGDKDGYGLKGGPPQDFFVQFVWPAIVSSRGLSTILERSFRHGDNPYLKTPADEPKAPAKEAKK